MPAQPHSGKVAVITGAASGIGRATTLLFAERGVRVVAADIDVRKFFGRAGHPAG